MAEATAVKMVETTDDPRDIYLMDHPDSKEEIRTIEPAIRACRSRGVDVSGPFPADTMFVRATRGEFDLVVACYHDQGLIPVKLLGFGHAVNVTLGLPIVRTSVDHGTAFDIAGKGTADAGSMVAAVLLAARLSRRREEEGALPGGHNGPLSHGASHGPDQ